MNGQFITKLFIAADTALVIAYDIFAFWRWGVDATISRVTLRWAQAGATHAAALGFVVGSLLVHLFWRQKISDTEQRRPG
jgi:hypothetical protein